MIGCDDMVFPRLNRYSYQVFLLSAIVLLCLFVEVAPSVVLGQRITLVGESEYNLTPFVSWVIAVGLEFVAFLMGGINFITTTMNSRHQYGLGHSIVVWTIVIASILFMASVGPLVAGCYARIRPTSGLAFSTLFAVVTLSCGSIYSGSSDIRGLRRLLPALGITAEVMCVFVARSCSPTRSCSTLFATGILSFFVWAHHQFISASTLGWPTSLRSRRF